MLRCLRLIPVAPNKKTCRYTWHAFSILNAADLYKTYSSHFDYQSLSSAPRRNVQGEVFRKTLDVWQDLCYTNHKR